MHADGNTSTAAASAASSAAAAAQSAAAAAEASSSAIGTAATAAGAASSAAQAAAAVRDLSCSTYSSAVLDRLWHAEATHPSFLSLPPLLGSHFRVHLPCHTTTAPLSQLKAIVAAFKSYCAILSLLSCQQEKWTCVNAGKHEHHKCICTRCAAVRACPHRWPRSCCLTASGSALGHP